MPCIFADMGGSGAEVVEGVAAAAGALRPTMPITAAPVSHVRTFTRWNSFRGLRVGAWQCFGPVLWATSGIHLEDVSKFWEIYGAKEDRASRTIL